VTEELQFLELSLPANDIRRSLEWYRDIGFQELSTNDVRSHHYAVVSSGDFALGLHGGNLAAPALTFVQPNMARHIRDRMEQGEEFLRADLGVDDFHEAIQADPDGSLAITLEARTFSPGDESAAAGKLHSLSMPCMRVSDSLEFWQGYGFIAVESEDADHAELHAPGVIVAQQTGNRDVTIRFMPPDYDGLVERLNGNYELRMLSNRNMNGVELRAPEGTLVQLLRS